MAADTSPTGEPVIEMQDVTKSFVVRRGRLRRRRTVVHAVDGISLAVRPGEVVGYIGPNGAGKSTTIKMLTGILVPTSGRITVAGMDPQRQRAETARRVGVVFGQRTQLWWDLPLRDSFDLLRHIYRVPAAVHSAALEEMVDLLDLSAFLDTPVRQLSLGQRVRGEITAALLHRPSVVYLDEPTIGLDVVSKARVRTFLAELNRTSRVTVILTTHDLDDVEHLCSRLVVIDRGRVVHDGTLAEVKARFAPERTVIVDLEQPAGPLVVPGAEVVRVDGARQWVRFRPDDTTAAQVIAAVAAAAPIRDVTIQEPSIEEVIHRMYGEAAR
ncbi:MAG TPA: ATP-binding cassette domain-containing protein [Acidimicrobiales bacterium]|nr:ATP-binding cassette domain-containing protein [Acidimicrobiales bacterium]